MPQVAVQALVLGGLAALPADAPVDRAQSAGGAAQLLLHVLVLEQAVDVGDGGVSLLLGVLGAGHRVSSFAF